MIGLLSTHRNPGSFPDSKAMIIKRIEDQRKQFIQSYILIYTTSNSTIQKLLRNDLVHKSMRNNPTQLRQFLEKNVIKKKIY